jgi:hypothetical protein
MMSKVAVEPAIELVEIFEDTLIESELSEEIRAFPDVRVDTTALDTFNVPELKSVTTTESLVILLI